MNAKERALAASLLRTASDDFANHGCNDWEWPADWTHEQKTEFVREYHEWNDDPEEFDADYLHLPDFAVMAFLAHKITDEVWEDD